MHDAAPCRGSFAQALPTDPLVVEQEASRFQPGAVGKFDAVRSHFSWAHGLFPVKRGELFLSPRTARPGQRRSEQHVVVDGWQEERHYGLAPRKQGGRDRDGMAGGIRVVIADEYWTLGRFAVGSRSYDEQGMPHMMSNATRDAAEDR